MSLSMLFKDELKGFYKSKVMIFLWVGLPAMALLLHLWIPSVEGEMPIPSSALSAMLVSSVGGTLASVMLAVSIINEKNRRVYDLFLIRPIQRRDIIVSKFLAVYVCLIVATLLAIAVGLVIDYVTIGATVVQLLEKVMESVALSLALMAVSSSVGILIGVGSPSVLVGVILVIYGGNQIAMVPMLPTMIGITNGFVFTLLLGVVVTLGLMLVSIAYFNRKQF